MGYSAAVYGGAGFGGFLNLREVFFICPLMFLEFLSQYGSTFMFKKKCMEVLEMVSGYLFCGEYDIWILCRSL